MFTVLIFFSRTLPLYKYFQDFSYDILNFSVAQTFKEIFFKTILLHSVRNRIFDRASTFTQTFYWARTFIRTFDLGVFRRPKNDLTFCRLLLMLWKEKIMMNFFKGVEKMTMSFYYWGGKMMMIFYYRREKNDDELFISV